MPKSTLRSVIAQRLVRQLCDRCKTRRSLTAQDVAADPRYRALRLEVPAVGIAERDCRYGGSEGVRRFNPAMGLQFFAYRPSGVNHEPSP